MKTNDVTDARRSCEYCRADLEPGASLGRSSLMGGEEGPFAPAGPR